MIMNKLLKPAHLTLIIMVFSLFRATDAAAAVVESVLNDSVATPPKITILGSGLAGATFKLAGVDIPVSCTTDVSSTEQHIGYCAESALAVPGPGSYKLLIDGTTEFSIYFEQAIVVPAPPPPPPLDNNCACVTGSSIGGSGIWSQPPIPYSDSTLCLWDDEPIGGPYTHQVWITGSFTFNSNSYTISSLWDPNNTTYDPSNPDNSSSICALHNNTTKTYEVHHPVASEEQFKACFGWMLSPGPCI